MFRRSNSGGLFFLQIETNSNKNVKCFFCMNLKIAIDFKAVKVWGNTHSIYRLIHDRLSKC